MTDQEVLQANKDAAVDFLQLVVQGQVEEAYRKHVAMQGVHHNQYFPAGFPALMKAMQNDEMAAPGKLLLVKHVLGEADLVAVHSHLVMKEGDPGMITLHMFRFRAGKVVEMWDMGEAIPASSPNTAGAF